MKIAAKIKESVEAARQLGVDVMMLEKVASILLSSDPPTMPPDLLHEVSSQLSSVSKSIRSAAKSYGESIDEIVERIELFIIAAQEKSKSNWDKARGMSDDFWNSDFGDAFDKALPSVMSTVPGGQAFASLYGPSGPLDASDAMRGASDAALGLGEVSWMLASMDHDLEQRKKFDAMVKAIGDDPTMVLESLVGLEELKSVKWKDVAAGKKDSALSHWFGGLSFDITLGLATDGLGSVGRGSRVAEAGTTAARRAWKEAAEKELAKVQADLRLSEMATGAALKADAHAGEAAQAAARHLEEISGGNAFMPFKPDPNYQAAATDWGKAVGEQSDAGRRLVEAQKAGEAIDQRLTVAEINFRQAAQKLTNTHVDIDGLVSALGNVNKVTQIIGLDVPLDRVAALLKAAQLGRNVLDASQQ